MARIIHLRSDVSPVFIADVKHRSQIVPGYEHGQSRFVGHFSDPTIDAAVQKILDDYEVTGVTPTNIGAATVGNDQTVTIAGIKASSTQIGNHPDADDIAEEIQELLAPRFVETSDFDLSVDKGNLKGFSEAFKILDVTAPILKVTQDDGATAYEV